MDKEMYDEEFDYFLSENETEEDVSFQRGWKMVFEGKRFCYWEDKDGNKLTNMGYIITPEGRISRFL